MKVDIKIVIQRKEASKIKSSAARMVEKYKTQEKNIAGNKGEKKDKTDCYLE